MTWKLEHKEVQMSMINRFLKKSVIAVALAALVLAAMPLAGASALSPGETPTPPSRLSTERLERAWAREQRVYERLGELFGNSDTLLEKAQSLIDRAKANGKDVSAVQAALDAFAAAIKQARPIYESGKGILASHQGFDTAGKVTDPDKAIQTVTDLRAKLKEIHETLGGTGKALREAIRAFRQANKPVSTPNP
jgi:hypothetical protein